VNCGTIDLPDEIVSALERDQLVIFAGAGVSMGQPAAQPDFDGLAKEISGDSTQNIDKPIDEFLGDLAESGVKVHQLCREIIRGRGSNPNEIHRDILRLFRAATGVRIVTSNFDTHFSCAAEELGWTVPFYEAPALPLGRDFSGIVHLHGSILGLPANLVLTDADFGCAYLTDAWASTFLRSLFAEFTILFIGYSHRDPPIRYLARGLTGRKGPRRFALTDEEDLGRWRSMGITPVPYPKREEPDAHGALNDGIRRWAEITLLQPLDIEAWLRKILTGPADIAPNPSESDFLRRCLQRDDRAQYFVRYAQHWRWVEWLYEQKLFAGLLETEFIQASLNEETEESAQRARHRVASWLGERLASEMEGRGLWLVRQAGGQIGPVAASGLVFQLTKDQSLKFSGPQPAAWIALICQSSGLPRRGEMLGQLLEKLAQQSVWHLALEVLGNLCSPVPTIEEHWAWLGPEPHPSTGRVALRLTGGAVYLRRAWELYFKPALPLLGNELQILFEATVQSAHRLARSLGEASDQTDPLLTTRSRIQSGSPYSSNSDLGLVLTLFCEVVSYQAQAQQLPVEKIDQWLTGSNPILYRIGLHALKESTVLQPKQKLDWLTGLIYRPVSGARHEACALAKTLYPKLTEPEKATLWQAIEAGPPSNWIEHLEPERRAEVWQSQIDRFVLFLYKEFPTDPLAQGPYARLEERAPGFVKAKHPALDQDFWFGGVRDAAQSPKSVEEILMSSPEEQLDYFLIFKTEDPFEETREGLVSNVARAAGQNPTWGVQLLRALGTRDVWNSDLWNSVFWKLSFVKLPAEDQRWLLSHAADKLSHNDTVLDGLTFFLFNSGLFAKEDPVDPDVLEDLVDVSLALWVKARSVPPNEHDNLAKTDWVSRAINRPAGRIVAFWLQFTENERDSKTEPMPGWPARLASAFDELATAQTPADWQGLAIIGLHLAFVRYIAQDWVRTKIYPLLDFATNGDHAWPLWSSFVFHSRFNRDLLLELPTYYPTAAPLFASAPEDVPRNFLASVGLIIYPGLLENVADWLRSVLLPFDETQRAGFASSLAQALRGLPAPEMAAFWHRWMHDYWRERLKGRPFSLAGAEAHAMLEWVWLLPPLEFAEAVPLVLSGPEFESDGWSPMTQILDSPLPAAQPSLLLDLWAFIVEHAKGLYYVDEKDYQKLLGLLPKNPVLREKWERVCQALSRHGASCAEQLFAEGRVHFTA
jgi:hypothetical protein